MILLAAPLADPPDTNTLRTKAEELEAHIAKMERTLHQVRADLAHINAAIILLEAPAAGTEFPLHFNLGRMFKGCAVDG